jgi:hypothetical protein
MKGLVVIVNYSNKQIMETFSDDDINVLKIKLIDFLSNEFNKRIIDYPTDYEQLPIYWFDGYILNDVFLYKVFLNDWIEPWSYDEIYSEAIDKLIQIENQNPVSEYVEYENDEERQGLQVIAKNQEELYLEQ